MTKKIEQVKPVCNDQLDSHGSADEVVGTIGQICKQTDTPAYKMAYRKAYDKAQAGGMNNSDSNDFAIERAEFAIKQAEISAKSEDKTSARPWHITYPVSGLYKLPFIGSVDGFPIAEVGHTDRSTEKNLADAALIVKAVNEHALLLAVAEAAEKVSMLLHDMTTEHFRTGYDKVEREALDKALAALRQG